MQCPREKISKRINNGCPQGSVCGPIFWNLLFEELQQLAANGNISAAISYLDYLMVMIEGNVKVKAANGVQLLKQCCDKVKVTIQ